MNKYQEGVFLKKLLLIFVCALTLCSCGKKDSAPEKLAENFDVNARICDGDFEAEAKMSRSPEGWQITVTSPETIEGMNITLTQSDCRIAFSELTYNVKSDELPENSPLRLTARALDKAAAAKTSGSLGDLDYSLSFKDGSPQTLKIGPNITAEFDGYKKTNKEK